MADLKFDDDLVELQRAYVRAAEVARDLCDAFPPPTKIAAGEVVVDPALEEQLEVARAERGRLVHALYGHTFWDNVADKFAAHTELQKVAAAQAGE
ncbi:hypothetical protein F5972_08225 [Microbispora cellulosiformans]|uniref:Uncharacterized protein n=1 Tax=Microbispora cellulosiformans TaxID=2614688 RepID=A0A5J5K676_9ACTN|nr:hypothetical protein [Microbispora cellulosiformans]KAA9379630.1 hypothetical protein F5972_08225 [Microbispora cellulosiformans]